jgi:hypothetical protein
MDEYLKSVQLDCFADRWRLSRQGLREASEPKARLCPLTAAAHCGAHAGGIYLLTLEAAVRAAKESATTASTSRFVPVTSPAAKAS